MAADPLSLAASVAGLVSLGLQVSDGIIKYIDAIKSRDEELTYIRKKNDLIRSIIQNIQHSSSNFMIEHPQSILAVTDTIQLCDTQLKVVNCVIADFVNSSSDPIPSTRTKVKDLSRKFKYPFKREQVNAINSKLDQTIAALQLALHSLGLDLSKQDKEKLVSIQTDLQITSRAIQNTLKGLSNQAESQAEMLAQKLDRIEKFLLDSASGGTGTRQNQSAENLRNLKTDRPLQRKLLHRALSKPRSLKEVCDTIDLETNIEDPTMAILLGYHAPADSTGASHSLVNRYRCDCNARSRHRQHDSWLGSLGFFHKTKSVTHLPDCPMAEFPTLGSFKEVGFRFLWLRDLLGSAITLSFMLNSGAGGHSIGPLFTYHPTVDQNSDPAFQMLHLMRSVIYLTILWEPTPNDLAKYKHFMDRATVEFKELFRNGKSNLLAVDSDGWSLAHLLILLLPNDKRTMTEYSDRYVCDLLEFFKCHQVPLMEYNTRGHTPLSVFALKHELLSTRAVQTLLTATKDTRQIVLPQYVQRELRDYLPFDLVEHYKLLAASPLLAEAFDCGPLSQAILADDLSQVKRILNNSTSAMEEQDVFGRSPLHFAGARPRILKSLLEAANADQLNAVCLHGQSPLNYAIILSKALCCSTNPEQRCSRCNCADCVIALLNAECAVWNATFTLLSHGTIRCRNRIIRHGKQRRKSLKKMAIDSIADDLAKDILQSRGVLDYHAIQVELMLQGQGISIPRALGTGSDERGGRRSERSFYATKWSPTDAECFYRVGFTDTDPQPPHELPIWSFLLGLDHFRWLIDHGVDLSRKLTRHSNVICNAHYVLARVAMRFEDEDALSESEECAFAEILRRSHNIGIADSCRCDCSPGGCTPQISMLKEFAERHSGNTFEKFDRHLEIQDRLWGLEDHMKAMRFLTFDALGLHHTCCDLWWNLSNTDEDEVEEEDEPFMLDLFDELISEFEGHIRSIPEGESYLSFWRSYWKVRIEEVQKSLDARALSKYEIQKARDLGVVWDTVPQTQPQRGFKTRQELWDDWFLELDKIKSSCT